MKLFGFNITRQKSPPLDVPASSSPKPNDPIASVASGWENPNEPLMPRGTSKGNLALRDVAFSSSEFIQIYGDKITPQQLTAYLISAQQGNFYSSYLITSRMEATWPGLRRVLHEIREAASRAKYQVMPFAVEGEKPSAIAIEKAKGFAAALQSFNPDPRTDEKGFEGMVYDLGNALVSGVVVENILWSEPADTADHTYKPRAAVHVLTPQLGFTSTHRIGYMPGLSNMTFGGSQQAQELDLDKFIIGQYQTRSGPATTYGLVLTLAWFWMGFVYGREWLLKYAQIFGSPVRWANYKQGSSQATIDKVEALLAQMGNCAYGAFPEGVTLMLEAAGNAGPDNPQRALMEIADKAATLLIARQTLTSDVSAAGGSRALGEVHADTKEEAFIGLAKWIASSPLDQLAHAWSRLNYGNEDEVPIVTVVTTKPEDPLQAANRVKILLDCGIKLRKAEVYEKIGFQVPEEGDELIEPRPALQPMFGQPQLDDNGQPLPPENQLPWEEQQAQAREFLKAAMGNGDKHQRIYEFRSVPLLSDKGRSPAIAAASAHGGTHRPPASAAATADADAVRKFAAARKATFAPLVARLKAAQAITDDAEFMREFQKIYDDLPAIAAEALTTPHRNLAASALAGPILEALK